MNSSPPTEHISNTLINWYSSHKRDLPWRRTSNPYLIWVSEVILQQTQVAQGMDYFIRFTHLFPTVEALASASETDVLKAWQGLGYYSRARNMHKAAQQIVNHFGGQFPTAHQDVLSLSGVGDYTAAAICSIAFGQPYAVLDGNVFRVLSRLYGVDTPINTTQGKKAFRELADLHLSKANPGTYNQAIMDFGAMVCTPKQPSCDACPLSDFCMAYAQNAVTSYPVKQGVKKSRTRYFAYLHIIYNDKTYLQKRTQQDIWKNMYEFPLIESATQLSVEEVLGNDLLQHLSVSSPGLLFSKQLSLKHVLSHQIIYADFYRIEIKTYCPMLSERFIEIPQADISLYPVSRLVDKYLQQ